jgi:hypothetical protein
MSGVGDTYIGPRKFEFKQVVPSDLQIVAGITLVLIPAIWAIFALHVQIRTG